MKKIIVALCALCLLVGCGQQAVAPNPNTYEVYFAARSATGSALASEPVTVEPYAAVTQLMEALLRPPTDPALRAIIPTGVTLLGIHLDDEGRLTVDLSEHYGSLADIDLTLADCAITLTLCQIPQIKEVSITVAGDPIPFRDMQHFDPTLISLTPNL